MPDSARDEPSEAKDAENRSQVANIGLPANEVGEKSISNLFRANKIPIAYGVLLFAIFAGFRGVLEYFAGSFPLGNDSVDLYEVWLRTGQPIDIWNLVSKSLLYGINSILNDPSLTVKILLIALQGLLAVAVYIWVHSITKDPRISFLAAIATCFYFPILRITWDLARNSIALIFGLMALTLFQSKGKSRFALANACLFLAVLSDVIVFPVVLSVILFGKSRMKRKLAILLPSVALFSMVVVIYLVAYLQLGSFSGHLNNIALALKDYILLNGQSSYEFLGITAPLFFLYLLLPIAPFLIFALAKTRNLNLEFVVWVIVCFALGFTFPGYRFILLVFVGLVPMIAVQLLRTRRTRVFKMMFILILFMGFSYATFSAQSPFPYYDVYQPYSYLLPSSLMANSLPISENYATMQILNANILRFDCNSKLITTSAFYDFALKAGVPTCSLTLRGGYETISNVVEDLIVTASNLAAPGRSVYVIWFVPSVSSEPSFWDNFRLIGSSGDIGLFVFT
ncbi:MAG: hypothetical protein ACYC7D_04925 [Nitrososphaerales archaeon]